MGETDGKNEQGSIFLYYLSKRLTRQYKRPALHRFGKVKSIRKKCTAYYVTVVAMCNGDDNSDSAPEGQEIITSSYPVALPQEVIPPDAPATPRRRARINAKTPTYLDSIIGNDLKKLRESKNVSRKELVRRMLTIAPPGTSVTENQIRKYETGESRISISRMVQMLTALAISRDEYADRFNELLNISTQPTQAIIINNATETTSSRAGHVQSAQQVILDNENDVVHESDQPSYAVDTTVSRREIRVLVGRFRQITDKKDRRVILNTTKRLRKK